MSSVNIQVSNFPDVPNVAGAPAVLRVAVAGAGSFVNSPSNASIGTAQGMIGGGGFSVGGGIAASNGQLSNVQYSNGFLTGASSSGYVNERLISDDPSIAQAMNSQPSQWGVFESGTTTPVLSPDSFLTFGYKQSWRVSNFPMEQGAFQSYNKVQTPFEVSVSMTQSGSDSAREGFLNSVGILAQDTTNLYDISTPEHTYTNVTLENYDYQRTSTNGAKLLKVDMHFVEIRLAPSQAFSNTSDASGTDAVNTGSVQALPITTGDTNTVASITSDLTGIQSFVPGVNGTLMGVLNQGAITPQSVIASQAAINAANGTVTPANNFSLNQIANSVNPYSASVATQIPTLNVVR